MSLLQKPRQKNKTFIKKHTCGVLLCLVASASDQNCFYKHPFTSLNEISVPFLILQNQHCVACFCERRKTNNTFSILYSACVILQWVLRDYKNACFITYVFSGRYFLSTIQTLKFNFLLLSTVDTLMSPKIDLSWKTIWTDKTVPASTFLSI